MSLDPQNWAELRQLGHRMIDDMFAHLEHVRDRPAWIKMPADKRARLHEPLPRSATNPAAIYADFSDLIKPYSTGNTHPMFMGWVHGGGTAVGMLADMLAAGLNANLGGRDHAPIEVERQVISWCAELLGFPQNASGVLVSGTSMANLIGVLVARHAALGPAVRRTGLAGARLVAYASAAAHSCLARAMDFCGLGSDALRLIACDRDHRMDVAALEATIERDRAAGLFPFLVVGTAGTVDSGAIDDLAAIAHVAGAQGIWFHVDGAFGAMAALSAKLRPLLHGISAADSVAFDFHKWLQVPYDAGCILVRDAVRHHATFAHHASYLSREVRGAAAGHPWPCDFGPDLSRGFRALKVWMTLKTYGADRLGESVEQCCAVARALAQRIDREPVLERLAPVALNIVCFRVRASAADSDQINRTIVADLQEAGIAVPSTTIISGNLAIRAAIVNHRTTLADAEALVDAVLSVAKANRSMQLLPS
jgi:glutamate/tyrosine decarboxylase-like PLP-dependent enzyme